MAWAAAVVAAFTGLRAGEIEGLRWEDYRDGLLHVRRSVWSGKISEVKTLASKAPVPVNSFVADALAQHLKRNTGDGYIFHVPTDAQIPVRLPNLVRRTIRPTLTKAGIAWHGFHAFRRGLATNLAELGIPIEVAQDLLRHSDSTTTKKFYAKPSATQGRKALDLVGKAFKKTKRAS
jgi:integrase